MAQITLNSSGVASNGTLALQSNGTTTAVTIDASQNVGIGISPNASSKLQVKAATNSNVAVWDSSGTPMLLGLTDAGASQSLRIAGAPLTFTGNGGGGAEAMRIDTSGNLGIGTSSPSYRLHVSDTAGIQGFFKANSAGSSYIRIDESAGTLQSIFGTDGTAGFCGMLSNHAFTIRTNNTERMRIDSSGRLLVGCTATDSAAQFRFQYGTGQNGLQLFDNNGATGSTFAIFAINSGSPSNIGSISRVGATAAVIYNTTSDYRLKTVTGAVNGQGERIDALKPVDYQWKNGGTTARGFLAHEFQEIYPSSVTGSKDAVDSEGKPVYQAMQTSTPEVIADLVAEIQSLRKRLATLEAK